jgi:hypothetical protein
MRPAMCTAPSGHPCILARVCPHMDSRHTEPLVPARTFSYADRPLAVPSDLLTRAAKETLWGAKRNNGLEASQAVADRLLGLDSPALNESITYSLINVHEIHDV